MFSRQHVLLTMIGAALLALLALLAGCGGGESPDPFTANTPGAGADSPSDFVGGETRLLSPGVGARMPLRYQVPDGDRESFDMVIVLGVTAGMGANHTFVESPPISFEVSMGPVHHRPDGRYRYEMKVRHVGLDLPEGTPEELATALSAEIAQMGRIEGWLEVDDRGITRGVRGPQPTGVPPRTQTMLGNIRSALQSIPFPEEPVGIGARWQVERTVDLHTHDVDQVVTYELVDLAGTRGQLRITVEQTAEAQPLHNLPAGAEGRLDTYVGRGNGEAVFDLTSMTPLVGLAFQSAMHATSSGGASELTMETHSSVTVRPR
ncbi:MAG: hypothetical protein JRH11_11985 [Deltaproteobacteria bacterium]|nr:hypothetical protein [Deltaproteobacteria bacterium]